MGVREIVLNDESTRMSSLLFFKKLFGKERLLVKKIYLKFEFPAVFIFLLFGLIYRF